MVTFILFGVILIFKCFFQLNYIADFSLFDTIIYNVKTKIKLYLYKIIIKINYRFQIFIPFYCIVEFFLIYIAVFLTMTMKKKF